MENNEEIVTEITENVEEQATEELVEGNNTTEAEVENTNVEEKLYSQSEFDDALNKKLDEILPKKIARNKDKIRREYEEKYGRVENVIKAGTGNDNFDEAIEELENFYKEKGVEIKKYTSDFDTKAIANARADEIISGGYEEIVERVDFLADKIEKGKASNLEKIEFQKIATERQKIESERELAKIGVKVSDLSDEYKSFAKKLNSNMSEKEKYEMYLQYHPKKEIKPIGSMKSSSAEEVIKDFYTFEEASKFTKKDLDSNPKLVEAIEKSMQKWK